MANLNNLRRDDVFFARNTIDMLLAQEEAEVTNSITTEPLPTGDLGLLWLGEVDEDAEGADVYVLADHLSRIRPRS